MLILFGLVGAAFGAVMAGTVGALLGMVAGPILLLAVRREAGRAAKPASSPHADPALSALARRVQELEQQLAALRAQVYRLVNGVQTPAQTETIAPAAHDQPLSPAPSMPVTPEPVATFAPEDLTLRAVLPAPAAPKAQPQFALNPAATVASAPVAAATAASTAPRVEARSAPSPRPPKAPPPLPLRDRLPPFMSRWIFGGNTIVKVGVLILFLGLAFLLRYAAERVSVPVELRYAGVALVGAFLLGLGWRLRARTDAAGGHGYGLILQGAGIGIFYLTALAAIKLHPLLPTALAFVFMAAVAVLGALLAVAQNAPWLALVSVAEGFAAPVLVSTGGGNHIALFSYLAILDVGIFLIAWSRAWRELNLLGAASTFALAIAWAQRHYNDSLYPSVQAFLLLFFLLFTAIGVMFARRALAQGDAPDARQPLATRAAQALERVGRVDSTLTFGVPLAAFSLQYLLVRGDEWGPAWAAFGFALFYLLLGGALLRGGNARYSLLGEAYVIVSVIFGTLTIPLALEGVWTGATWAVEAAGMYWLGARQHRPYARAFALVVIGGAALRLATELGVDWRPGTPLITGSTLGIAMLAASAVAIGLVRRRVAAQDHSAIEDASAVLMPVIAVASITAIAWMLCPPMWAGVITAWLAFGCAALHSRLAAPVLQLCAALLHGVALTSLALSLHTVAGQPMLAHGWEGLAVAALIGTSLLLTGWLGLGPSLRVADGRTELLPWSLASGLGLLAGLAVVSLSFLFVMPADRAALVWPWLGLGSLCLGLRVRHPALAWGWFALQVVAGIATLAYGPAWWVADLHAAHVGSSLWGPLVLAVAALIAGDLLQRAARHSEQPGWLRQRVVHWAVVVWAIAWWANVLPPELHRQLQLRAALTLWPTWLNGWLILTSVAMVVIARWRDWRVLGQATWATVPAWILLAVAGPVGAGIAPSADFGWAVWPLALAWHLALLRRQPAWWPAPALQPLHVAGFWLFLWLAARECQLQMESLGASDSAWATLGWVLAPAAVLTLITRPALLRRWPLAEHRETYLGVACTPVALYLLLWLWVGNAESGSASLLPYVPLLNPLELGQGLVLLVLMLWLRALPTSLQQHLPRPALLATLGATAFALYTGMVLRICHHWAGVGWSGSALFASTLTQAALSVAWSVVGVALMLAGHRRGRRIVWIVGAALLGVVVAKLFLVELADRGGLYRIVSFIVVGVLLLVVGYFAPIPPKRDTADPRRAAASAA